MPRSAFSRDARLQGSLPLGRVQSGGTQATPGTGTAAGATASSADVPEEVLCGGDRTAANAPGENIQWVVNLGGVAEPKQSSSKSPVYQVRGGVVVPLYVIVLALFGSAISMTRRVPEYQQRAMDSQDALTNVEARQRLVFQFMQVLSAPLIAITVYYIYKPAVPAESVVIGFGSGFASEPILLMIRGLVEKLSPAQAVPQGQVSVRVDPDSVALGPKQTKQFTAKVQGSNNQDVTWHISPPEAGSGTISQSGLYYAPDVKADIAVTITAQSAADRSKSGSATVKLSPVAVKVDPLTAKVKVATTRQFGAEVSGLANSKVTWAFDHPPSNPGTISEVGLYTAPPSSPGSPVTIKAISSADPTISGSATITVEA